MTPQEAAETPPKTHVRDLFDLTGRVAVVTGGAGLYGRQIVEALAEAGARTFMASRNLDKLRQQADAFARQGLSVTPLPLDQADQESVNALLAAVVQQAGGVDVLVNNAVLRPMRDWNSPAEDFALSMAVNVTGLFLMTRAFGDHMAQRGGGSIINVGSIQGRSGARFHALRRARLGHRRPTISSTRAACCNSRALPRRSWGPSGVRVNTVIPGGFFNNQDPRFVARYNARTFLGRMANEHDLKGAIVFLASAASAYVTGTSLAVDGGYMAK